MGIVDWVATNYWDIALISSLFFTALFGVAAKLSKNEQYGPGLLALAVSVCSVGWVLMIPYFIVGWSFDIIARLLKR
ncbi:putative TMhelix containing protein [Vibrio phage 217E38-1]|nr:putative TMhelix containing protein [Vibrio phage 217E38-1]